MRIIFCLLLGLTALLFALVGTTIPLQLPAQAAKDRIYYEKFKWAAASIDRNKQIPADKVLRKTQEAQRFPVINSSLTTPFDCDPSFKKYPEDRLILSFWRGEWTECYAYPSGRTTLPMTVQAYLMSGVGTNLAIYWLIAIGAAWGAIRLRPRKSASATLRANGS